MSRSRRLEVVGKEYPPPIPWLAQTDNRSSHMPWVVRKYYSGDGRLIIKEERVKRHEYFESHRSNGRLALNLIPLDDAVEESCKERHAEEEERGVNRFSDEKINGVDEGIRDPTVGKPISEYYYHKYNGMGVNPCGGFAVPAAAAAPFRPPVLT